MRRLVASAALALAAWASPAAAETMITSLSSQSVLITSTYTGAQLVLFGVIEADAQSVARTESYDVVVTVRGPAAPVVVREKRPLGPIWVNRAQRKFFDVPAVLVVLANRPLTQITTPVLRQRFRLGVETQVEPGNWTTSDAEADAFRNALIRLRTDSGLFVQNETAVKFLTPAIFRATIAVPATAPVGAYDVQVALLNGGVELTRQQTSFRVSKAGAEQLLAQEAFDRPVLYGLVTASLALGFGWLASVIFRRD